VKIAELENEKSGREKSLVELRDRIARLQHTIEKAQRKLIDLRQRATQAKQAQREGKARAKLGISIGGYGSLSEAEGIAERIDSLPDQVEAWDAFELDSQLSGKSVEQRLADEGHGDNKRATAASVLERLKTRATEKQ
jgi:phage shock protein A